MTFIKATEMIDRELNALEVKDRFGEVHRGIMVVPYIYKIIGDEFSDPNLLLREGKISIEEYTERTIALIHKCRKVSQTSAIMKRLAELHRDQVELDLI
jgi:hypothetical protein